MTNNRFKRFSAVILAVVLAFSCLGITAFAQDNEIKNVIVMIGDGMGTNHLEWTKLENDTQLYMDTLPHQGYSKTSSLLGLTDSAAGGTALSCGYKTVNSNIGTLALPILTQGIVFASFKNSCEAAISVGKRAGILTSDVCSGATPAAFCVHTASRSNTEDITEKELKCGINLLWACSNDLVTEENSEAEGWKYVSSLKDVQALNNGDRSFGVFSGQLCFDSGAAEDIPLSTLTTLAIDNLNCDKGFFLMVEGAHIDKYSHANDKENMMKSVLEFDKAVRNAVEFAKRDGHTAVVVTADHETGGITYNSDAKDYYFTLTNHSTANVPLRVYGSADLVDNGKAVENVEVAKFTASELGYTDKYPSYTVNYNAFGDFFKDLGKEIKETVTGWFE